MATPTRDGDKTWNLQTNLPCGGEAILGTPADSRHSKFARHERALQPMSDRAVAAIAVGLTVGVAIAVAVRRRSASDFNALAQAACAAEGKLARLAASAIRLTACVPGSE